MKDYLYIKLGAVVGSITLLMGGYFNKIEIVSPLILFLTFLAILWYSKETQELKEISIKRPFLSFNKYENIMLKNYGEGIARNIEIKVDDNIVYKIPLVSSIYSRQSGPIPVPDTYNDGKSFKDHGGEIYINYFDTSGKTKYTTITKWDDSINNRDGCKIINYSWKL